MIIDATNLIIGRLATVAAKKALQGETVEIINAELAVKTGKRVEILAEYKRRRERGGPLIGPFFPKQPDRFVKRTIRGMLPYKQPRGDKALKAIKCYVGVPKRFEGKETFPIENASVERITATKYVTVKEICTIMGGSI